MPNTKSAIKRVRIERKRRLRNRAVKSTTKTYVTRARQAFESDATAPATLEALRAAISHLDKASTKGVLHRNNVARRKSRLMKKYHAALAAQQQQ
jgi:small subunit ribosomal protein S20